MHQGSNHIVYDIYSSTVAFVRLDCNPWSRIIRGGRFFEILLISIVLIAL